MPSYNKVILVGHLTRDPQLKHIGSDSVVTEFGMAVNRKFKDKEEVTFVDCAAWGKQAEIINEHCRKGKALLVEGRLKLDTWEKDGQKRSKLSVVVENFQFIGSKDDGGREPATVGAGTPVRDAISEAFDPNDL